MVAIATRSTIQVHEFVSSVCDFVLKEELEQPGNVSVLSCNGSYLAVGTLFASLYIYRVELSSSAALKMIKMQSHSIMKVCAVAIIGNRVYESRQNGWVSCVNCYSICLGADTQVTVFRIFFKFKLRLQ
jgi:hypothetical protein